ncbi:MAG: hypothetical protein MJ219_00040 [Mycoplasmoidaceae bacterium]|nr:hypothetical protein [Mycoplasmoidaceae bacterium]
MMKRLIKAPTAHKRKGTESAAKIVTAAFAILFCLLFIGVVAFIIYGSIPG